MDSDSYADCISEIIPGFLYVGGCNAPANQAFLADRVIGYALNISDDVPRANTNHYKQIPIQDTMTEDLARFWDETTDFIAAAKAESAILVYDFSGVSRAPAFVMAYLMKKEGILLRDAYRLMVARRKWVNPNMHFMSLLSDLEFELFGVRSVLVVKEDRERAHLEFVEQVENPAAVKAENESDNSDVDDDKKSKKKKKKKKKKEKKEKRKGSLVLKQPQKETEKPKQPEATKRLKRDKFAWINDDIYDNSTTKWESGRINK